MKIWSHLLGCHGNKLAMYYCTMENAYATINLQVLPNLLTPAATRKKKSVQFSFCNSSIKIIPA
jgi:hypothetical protein